ncbi:protein of unknown function [Rhodovastum atsumiense]|nr:protein of unknown function [Rhodovastum atsumiense]
MSIVTPRRNRFKHFLPLLIPLPNKINTQ